MLPWLLNVYMDGVVREVNVRMLGKGLSLVNADSREWNLSQLLFADDTVLVTDSEGRLRLYGLGGRLLKGVKSFHVNSRACVRVGNGVSDWFLV